MGPIGKPQPPTVYSQCVESVATLERVFHLAGQFSDRLIGPVPSEAIGNEGPMPLQALANKLLMLSEAIEKRLSVTLDLLGG